PSSPSCEARECRISGLLQASATWQDGLMAAPGGKASKALLRRYSPWQGLAITSGLRLALALWTLSESKRTKQTGHQA
ncbi:MAG: hypothetical protein WBM61_13755, partial [Woeseiaceae bacterium]